VGYAMHLLPRKVDNAVMRGITRSGFIGQWLVMVVAIWAVMQCDMLLMANGGGGALPMYAAF